MFLSFVDFIFDKQAERRGHCAGCCYFFIILIKCTKKPFLKILTINELNINMDG